MSTDDFFKEIKNALNAKDQAKSDADHLRMANIGFAESVIKRLKPLAETYKAKMAEMGVQATVEAFQRALIFKVKYADGGYHGAQLEPDSQTGKIQLSGIYTEGGKNYRSTGTPLFDEKSWNDGKFEAEMKKAIKEALFYADRNGGLARIDD